MNCDDHSSLSQFTIDTIVTLKNIGRKAYKPNLMKTRYIRSDHGRGIISVIFVSIFFSLALEF